MRHVTLAVVGGVILFAWGVVGHVVLGIYDSVYQEFADETAVARSIDSGAARSGLYFVPADPDYSRNPEPHAFINYTAAGDQTPFAIMAVRGLFLQILSVLVVVFVLPEAGAHRYWVGVARIGAVGVIAGLIVHGYYWNWFGFPLKYFLISMLDVAIGWTLVGLVLGSRLCPSTGARPEEEIRPSGKGQKTAARGLITRTWPQSRP